MKTEIGIMTFHASNNCGSMLQAYALQYVIKKKLNMQNEIIDFSNDNQRNMYALIRKVRNYKDLLFNITTLFLFNHFKKHHNDYVRFKYEYLNLSEEKYRHISELPKEKYRILIAGSDQVWNINCPDADDAYFLSFTDKAKKIAYAPSFGAVNPYKHSKQPGKYAAFLKDFSSLSVRENNGRKWIYEMTRRDAEVLLDPTMLLDQAEWNQLADIITPKEDYIFYYAFNYSKSVNQIVREISRKHKMPVYILDIKSWIKRAFWDGIKITGHSGPKVFLSYLKNAKLVYTTSFHGTAFSIIYKKNFWFIDSHIHNPDDDRTYTLLEQLHLTDRCIKESEVNNKNCFENPDYTECYKLLKIEQKRSQEWLADALTK